MSASIASPAAQCRSYAPGARIRVRDEEWLVRLSQPIGQGHFAISCVGVSELVQGYEAVFMTDIDKAIEPVRVDTTELVRDTSAQFRRSKLYLESMLRRTHPDGADIAIGHRAAMKPSPFQLVPAAQALAAQRPRILIADGVGLGKTLEVGVLLAELMARGRGERILVVVMKSMLAQFQKELWTRFTIPLVRLDSVGLKRVHYKIPSGKNPFHYYKRAIISIDTLKNERQYRAWLEKCHWDAVVIDECHNVVNTNTGRNRVAKLLSTTSDALILTSATPHNGRPESFATLMNLLDPTAVADIHHYGPEDIQGLYVRRFKKDVEQEVAAHFPDRDLEVAWCSATAAEEAVFRAIEGATFSTLDRRIKLTAQGRARDMLFKTGLLKAYLSSPQALRETIAARIKRLDLRVAEGAGNAAGLRADLTTLTRIDELTAKIGTDQFSKIRNLFENLLPCLGVRGREGDPRLVIFSERLATIELLREVLCERLKLETCTERPGDGSLAVLTGAEPDVRIQEMLESFGSRDGKVRVLLASDMASEGINLHHFCHHLIHFDVPWSFIRLEQRNGRIDRFGQTEPPRIRYMLTRTDIPEARGDVHVVEKLIDKSEHARRNLGDEGAVLGLYNPDLEEQGVACVMSATAQQHDETIEPALADIRAEAEQAAAADSGADGADPEPWFLRDLFGVGAADAASGESTAGGAGPGESRTASATVRANAVTRQTLYDDDLAFLRTALEELKPAFKKEGEPLRVELHPQRPELTLEPPAELQGRFEQLPREARPREGSLFLTTDREAVERAIDESRDRKGSWPDLQLLWPLHPVLEWICDRVLVGFGRAQAPVLVLPHVADRFGGVDAVALMQGSLSNRRGQAVVVDWFGLPTKLGRQPKVGEAMELETVLDKVGLRGPTPNHGKPSALGSKLQQARNAWRDAGLAHMQQLRTKRMARLKPELVASQKRLKAWERQNLERLDGRKKDLMQGRSGPLRDRHLRRLEDEAEHVRRLHSERAAWLRDTMATDERPYLKLVAVLAAQ